MLGERIKKARIDAGLTQEDLAKKCNTTKQTIYKYEKGVINNIPFDRLTEIAQALKVDEGYLMGLQESPKLTSFERYYGLVGNPTRGFVDLGLPNTILSPNRRALLELAETASDEQISMLLRLAKAVLEEQEK